MPSRHTALFLKYWLPPLIWAAAIFYFSSLPSPPLLSEFSNYDKLEHIIGYAILAYLVVRLFKNLDYTFSGKGYLIYAKAFLVVFIYGFTIEIYQAFIPSRGCSVWDLLSDGIGACLGAFGYSLRVRKNISPKAEAG